MTAWPQRIIEQLKAYNVRFLSYVPDACGEHILRAAREDAFFDILPLAREEEGVGVVTGQYLVGERGAILMPTSGVGNSINAFASLAIPYHIPMPVFIGWRGALGEFNATQVPMVESLNIPHFILSRPEEVEVRVNGALKLAFALEQPVAVLISTELAGWKEK